jgi:hypothetical protein
MSEFRQCVEAATWPRRGRDKKNGDFCAFSVRDADALLPSRKSGKPVFFNSLRPRSRKKAGPNPVARGADWHIA